MCHNNMRLLHFLINHFDSYLMDIQHLQANHSIEQQHSIKFQKDRYTPEEYQKHIDSTCYILIHEHKIQMGWSKVEQMDLEQEKELEKGWAQMLD